MVKRSNGDGEKFHLPEPNLANDKSSQDNLELNLIIAWKRHKCWMIIRGLEGLMCTFKNDYIIW